MFSTKCTYCHTLISLKTEEVRAAVAEAETTQQTHYSLHCPKCQRTNKIQIKELKRHLPPQPKSEPAASGSLSEAQIEATALDSSPASDAPASNE